MSPQRGQLQLDELLALARLTLALGEVERATRHPDGARQETDTTHSVMVALVAAVVADRVGLDAGRAALFALVHDLPEIYAGDVDTSCGLSAEQRAAKAQREEEALARILGETASLPFLRSLLLRYELGDSPEAQLVHLVDKLTPKAVRLLQQQATSCGPITAEQRAAADRQTLRLRRQLDHPQLEGVLELQQQLLDRLVEP